MKQIKILFVLFFSILVIGFVQTANASDSQDESYKENQILVKFKRDQKKIFDSFLKDFASKHGLTYISEEKIIKNSQKSYFLFEIGTDFSVQNKLKEVKKDSRVKFAQPNFLFTPAVAIKSQNVPLKKSKSSQDRYFNREWWLYNNGTIGTAGSDIYLLNIWQQEQKNWPGVVVGIIDSGVNRKHTDLKKNIVNGYDFVHNKKKSVQDKEGHGSFIAGLIASQVSNKKGIAGMSRLNLLKVMPLKFDFSTDEAVSAIAFAQARGVRILNASWGTNEFDQALYDAIKTYNGLVVAAAGNNGNEHNGTNRFYPCDYDLENVICVGASDENDRMADYSDFGSTVDILAPGGSDGAPLISLDIKKDHYTHAVGTSFSTALVSGTAGLVLSGNPAVSNLEIKNLILTNARKRGDLTGKIVSGGILNVKGAVNREISQ